MLTLFEIHSAGLVCVVPIDQDFMCVLWCEVWQLIERRNSKGCSHHDQ